MMLYEDRERVARFLQCSSILEERVAEAYRSLSGRVKDSLIRSLLLYLSYDGQKHSIILRGIGESIAKLEIEEGDCEREWGRLWKRLVTLAKEEILKKEEVEDEELTSFTDKMVDLEGFVGEEYLTTVHISILQLMAKELKMNTGSLKKVLEWIIEDEKRHEEILIIIRNLILEKEQP